MRFNVAIVGSGPAGFYAAEALLQSDLPIQVDVIDRLPVPFGLVRHGIAPDHQRLKSVSAQFEKIADDNRFSFMGNLDVGRDVRLTELRAAYHAVILATGAIRDSQLAIPGEHLPGSVSATDLVGWYNGHPDFQHKSFDLSHSTAIVVGNGNVALDVCRILLKSVDELKSSDICEHALDVLSTSKITDVMLIGRRGPAQAKFTAKELRELGELAQAEPVIDAADLALNPASTEEISSQSGAAASKNIEILRGFSARTRGSKPKRLHFRFLLSPTSIEGADRLERVRFETLRLSGPAFRQVGIRAGEFSEIGAGLLVRSVGYRGHVVQGAPFDESTGTIPHLRGRVIDASTLIVPGLYVAGWIKRGPSGVVGTNRACAIETAQSIISDLQNKPPHVPDGRRERLLESLRQQFRQIVDFAGWRQIDVHERQAGAARAKPREKFTAISAMIKAAAPQTVPRDGSTKLADVNEGLNGVKEHAR